MAVAIPWFEGDEKPHFYEFHMARAMAVDSYASFEKAMCDLFALASETDIAVIGMVFNRINNARARVTMLDKLLRRKYGNSYRPFINPLLKALTVLSVRRNPIVHWGSSLLHTEHGKAYALVKPERWERGLADTALHKPHLIMFHDECVFWDSLITHFCFYLQGDLHDEPEAWHKIFQQPPTYPPHEGHPLGTQPLGPDNQLLAWWEIP